MCFNSLKVGPKLAVVQQNQDTGDRKPKSGKQEWTHVIQSDFNADKSGRPKQAGYYSHECRTMNKTFGLLIHS